MVEIIKEASGLLEKLPELSIWILCGILFYKVIFLGSIFGIIRLFINKFHDYLKGEKKTTISLDKHFIMHDTTPGLFLELIASIPKATNYIHSQNVEWAIEAIREKKERDRTSN